MEKQILSLLGLARRANRISMGFDASEDAIKKRNARLAIYTADASEKTVKRIRLKCDETDIPLYLLDTTMDELHLALGKRIGIMTVNDRGFADKLKLMLDSRN